MNVHSPPPLSTSISSPYPGVIADYKQPAEISLKEQQQIQQLQARDRVVRAHEAAHIAAGNGIVVGGSANYSYQRGPNGLQYAVGGEVQIDTSKIDGEPEKTLQKALQIQAAALAPAQPSSQDRAIAAKAAQMAVVARAEIDQQRNTEAEQQTNTTAPAALQEQASHLLDFTV